MKQIKILVQRLETAKQLQKDKLYKKFPLLTNINIYGDNNIMIESEHFSIDLYEGRTYTEANIRMTCKMEMSEIPTETQAIAQVKAMHLERKQFIKIMEYTIDKVLNDCTADEA